MIIGQIGQSKRKKSHKTTFENNLNSVLFNSHHTLEREDSSKREEERKIKDRQKNSPQITYR